MSEALAHMTSSRPRIVVLGKLRQGSIQASVGVQSLAWMGVRLRGHDGSYGGARIDAYQAKHKREAAE